jgi:putative ABC transport system permease protein
MLLSSAISESVNRNARGVDIVVGAKGSPLQLILSTLYHADIPTGNMSGAAARIISSGSQIQKSIPLALGDNVNGFRIVGTTSDYLSLYDAKFTDGKIWEHPLEAVAGAHTGIKTGDKFIGSHGLEPGGEGHAHKPYTVTGVLAPTGTVLDRLVITSVQSIFEIHNVIDTPQTTEDHGDDHGDHHHDHSHDHESQPHDHGPETTNYPVTALLLFTKAPVSRISLPRQINATSNLLAASPSFEITRLMQRIGIGRDATMMLSAGLGGLAILMILASLATGLSARGYDLAVLRVMGASPAKILSTIIAEGVLIALAGGMIGIAAGHGLAFFAAHAVDNLGGLVDPRMLLRLTVLDAQIIIAAAVAGLGAALLPAILGARADIANILSRGRT